MTAQMNTPWWAGWNIMMMRIGTCDACGARGVPVVRTSRYSDWSPMRQCADIETCQVPR